MTLHDTSNDPKENRSQAAIVWLGSFILLIGTIGLAPLNRTQEARVLETAREMLSRSEGVREWMIPHVNGIIRLQKPPLAYWLAAASFEILGVQTWTGRLPLALCGWLTVCLTHGIARRLFNARAAFVSACLLGGSFLFFRHARLAETDVLVTLTMTLAIAAILRGFEDDRSDLRWFALSGIAIGLAGIAKGPPAFLLILFLLCLIVVRLRWRVLWRWTISGAPILALAIALPWWIYARSLPQGTIVNHELSVILEGGEHIGKWWEYFPMLLKATLPWTPLLIVALVFAFVRARSERNLCAIFTWLGAIFIPLCIIPTKQDHYLVMLMPPLAILTGWWIARVVELDARSMERKLAVAIAILSIVVLIGGAIALPIIAPRLRGGDRNATDFAIALMMLVLGVAGLTGFLKAKLPRAMNFFAAISAMAMALILGVWAPTLQTNSPREIADKIRALGGDSYCFYGRNFSLPLVFELRTVVPQALAVDDLLSQLRAHDGGLVVIAQTKSDFAPPAVPDQFLRVFTIDTKEQRIEVYKAK